MAVRFSTSPAEKLRSENPMVQESTKFGATWHMWDILWCAMDATQQRTVDRQSQPESLDVFRAAGSVLHISGYNHQITWWYLLDENGWNLLYNCLPSLSTEVNPFWNHFLIQFATFCYLVLGTYGFKWHLVTFDQERSNQNFQFQCSKL